MWVPRRPPLHRQDRCIAREFYIDVTDDVTSHLLLMEINFSPSSNGEEFLGFGTFKSSYLGEKAVHACVHPYLEIRDLKINMPHSGTTVRRRRSRVLRMQQTLTNSCPSGDRLTASIVTLHHAAAGNFGMHPCTIGPLFKKSVRLRASHTVAHVQHASRFNSIVKGMPNSFTRVELIIYNSISITQLSLTARHDRCTANRTHMQHNSSS